jgi:GTP-binding protein
MTFLTSSSTGLGRKEFLDFIGGINEDVAKDFK